MVKMTKVFYIELNRIFKNLAEKYGESEDLQTYQHDLLDIYENENKYKSEALLKLLKPKQFQIDENGYVRRVGWTQIKNLNLFLPSHIFLTKSCP